MYYKCYVMFLYKTSQIYFSVSENDIRIEFGTSEVSVSRTHVFCLSPSMLAVSVRSHPRESQTLRAFAPVAARTGRTHVHFLCFDLERP